MEEKLKKLVEQSKQHKGVKEKPFELKRTPEQIAEISKKYKKPIDKINTQLEEFDIGCSDIDDESVCITVDEEHGCAFDKDKQKCYRKKFPNPEQEKFWMKFQKQKSVEGLEERAEKGLEELEKKVSKYSKILEYKNQFEKIKQTIKTNVNELNKYLPEIKDKTFVQKIKKAEKYLKTRFKETKDLEYLILYNNSLLQFINEAKLMKEKFSIAEEHKKKQEEHKKKQEWFTSELEKRMAKKEEHKKKQEEMEEMEVEEEMEEMKVEEEEVKKISEKYEKSVPKKYVTLFDILNEASNNYTKSLKEIDEIKKLWFKKEKKEKETLKDKIRKIGGDDLINKAEKGGIDEIIKHVARNWLNSDQGQSFKNKIFGFSDTQQKLCANFSSCKKLVTKYGSINAAKKTDEWSNSDCDNKLKGYNVSMKYYKMILHDYDKNLVKEEKGKEVPFCIKMTDYFQAMTKAKFLLPMWRYNKLSGGKPVEQIVERFRNVDFSKQGNRILILKSGTGTGKSVCVPPLLVEAGFSRRVVCTQPRKITATKNSEFACCLMGAKYGNAVGYKHGDGEIRGNKLVYMTDGMLVQELLSDVKKFIKKNSFIVIDEVHERSLNIDILLALVKKLLSKSYLKENPHKLQVIIMSATIDPQEYINYFTEGGQIDKSRIKPLNVGGTSFEIECKPSDVLPISNMYEHTADLINNIIDINKSEENESARDILVFLESASSIRKMEKELSDLNEKDYPVLTLTGQSSDKERDLAMKRPDEAIKRRVILATNVAETGLTFNYLKHVIDLGWMNTAVFNPVNGSSGLLRSHESINNAMQRRGRVGRTSPGNYYPLFKFCDVPKQLEEGEKELNTILDPKQQPGIYYNSLSQSLLSLINMLHEFGDIFGRKEGQLVSIYDFDFMDQPPITTLHRNLSELYLLGAINRNLELTKIGKMMYKMPRVSPPFAKAIIVAEMYHCTYEVAVIAACSSIQGGFYNFNEVPYNYRFNDFTDHQYRSDHINMLITFMKYSAVRRANNKYMADDWCIINRLKPGALNSAYNTAKQIIESLCKANIPILSYNRNISQYTNEMKMNILKALFTGLFLNTARLSTNIKFFKINNWYGKDYYSEVYKGSSFYTGDFRIKNLYPKNVFFGSVLMKDRNGMYINYLTGGMSPYDPEWIGTLVPNLD